MTKQSERYRLATKVDERHEVRFLPPEEDPGGEVEWLRVRSAMSFSGGGLRVRQFTFTNGAQRGVMASDEVMSRLAPKADALTPEEADAFARVARDRR